VALGNIGYCTVAPDGRLSQDMLFMHEGIRPELERVAREVHEAGGRLSGQMGHCGGFTKNKQLQGRRPLGPSRGLNLLGAAVGMPFVGAMGDADIDRMVDDYRSAAAFMKSVGFDALEIHFGHGYGLSQFISPKTNRRKDAYGGTLLNRMRLPLRVLEAVREAVGDAFPLLGKISLRDGVKGGLEEPESLEVAALLDRGGIDAIVPSTGTSSMNPMLLFHGDSLAKGMIEVEKSRLMRLALRAASPFMFKDYPYRELYLLEGARRVRDRVGCQVVYVGGVTTRASLEAILEEFELVQLGRALVRDPALVAHLRQDPGYVNGCTHCNRCATLIDDPGGIRCVLDDPAPAPPG
jgi:2,4-dienoyl-CoA reductase-like NADH-dependent reductase (Old Yellow Enzyme family)